MKKNWNGIDVAKNQYNTAEYADKLIQKNKIGNKRNVSNKIGGGSTPKNGIITN